METSRLVIRPYTADDFSDYFAYIMEPYLQQMLGLNGVSDPKSAWETFSWLIANREFLAIVPKNENRPAGHICIHPPYEVVAQTPAFAQKKGVSLSVAVGKPYRGKGYAAEALRAVIEYLFSAEDVEYIDYEYTSFNIPSENLAKKLGFTLWSCETVEDFTEYISILLKN